MTIPWIHGLEGMWVITPKGCKCVNMRAHHYPPMGNMGAMHVHACHIMGIPWDFLRNSTGWPIWSNPTNHGFGMVPSDLTTSWIQGSMVSIPGYPVWTPFWPLRNSDPQVIMICDGLCISMSHAWDPRPRHAWYWDIPYQGWSIPSSHGQSPRPGPRVVILRSQNHRF